MSAGRSLNPNSNIKWRVGRRTQELKTVRLMNIPDFIVLISAFSSHSHNYLVVCQMVKGIRATSKKGRRQVVTQIIAEAIVHVIFDSSLLSTRRVRLENFDQVLIIWRISYCSRRPVDYMLTTVTIRYNTWGLIRNCRSSFRYIGSNQYSFN